MLGSSSIAEELEAFQEGLSSKKLVPRIVDNYLTSV
jgi:hypothetical protein